MTSASGANPAPCLRRQVERSVWLSFALWTPVAQAGPAARLIGNVVLEVALAGGPPADRANAGGVPDLGQVPQLDPGVVPLGREPVITVLGGEGVQLDDQVRAGPGGM
jgi:hypothetical protein